MTQRFFFGYPAQPGHLAEVMRETARQAKPTCETTTWEDLKVGGTVVIRSVLQAIDAAAAAVFDVTYLNENVLFETGYALARAKPLWLTLDSTVAEAQRNWNELAILKPIGYEAYHNSGELSARLMQADLPNLEPLYDTLIEPNMPDETTRSSLLYCPPFEPFEAATTLDCR